MVLLTRDVRYPRPSQSKIRPLVTRRTGVSSHPTLITRPLPDTGWLASRVKWRRNNAGAKRAATTALLDTKYWQ